jgi:uncharacterized protein (TIGR02145 family)
MRSGTFIFLMMLTTCIVNNCTVDNSDDINNATSVKDIDGNTYKTLTIGNQVWFAENLKTRHYNNGNEIPTSDEFPTEISPKYQWPVGGDESNVEIYGRLYTWAALTDSRGICPEG